VSLTQKTSKNNLYPIQCYLVEWGLPGSRIQAAVDWLWPAHRVGDVLAVVVGDARVAEVQVRHVAVDAE
jgi:hypothetical protein